MAKMLHFPGTGLSPRPFDAYDACCQRYFTAYKNLSVRRELEAELKGRFGSRDLDVDYSHGRNVVNKYRVSH